MIIVNKLYQKKIDTIFMENRKNFVKKLIVLFFSQKIFLKQFTKNTFGKSVNFSQNYIYIFKSRIS